MMRAHRCMLVFALIAVGCDGRSSPVDAGSLRDASVDAAPPDAGRPDAGPPSDAGVLDAGSIDAGLADAGATDAGHDASTSDAGWSHDGGADGGVDAGTDAGTPPRSDHHIHIAVDNFCNMTVTPTEVTIPPDQTAYFAWHNHSADYEVTVWMSYGGGYTDLATGATWNEPIGHCSTPLAHDEWADISTACSSFRFLIHCN